MKLRLLLAAALAAAMTAAAQDEPEKPAGKPQKPVILLDKSPRIIAFQIGRLSNAELLLADRATTDKKFAPIYEAILARPGMDVKFRRESISALAKINQSDDVAEIIAGVKRLGDEKDQPVLAELTKLLLAQKPDALQKRQVELEALAAEAAQPAQKKSAFAALAAFQPADALWTFAEGKDGGLSGLLNGLTLVADAQRRGPFFAKIEPLLQKDDDAELRRAAILAAGRMPGREAAMFAALAKLFPVEPAAVVHSLMAMPKDKWPDAEIKPLAESLVAFARKVPDAERTADDFLDTVQFGRDLAAKLPPAEGAALRKTLAGLAVSVIRLRTVHEQMFFDTTRIVVELGKPVEIIFENPDAMPHNFVVTAPGAREEIGKLADAMPPEPDEQGRAFVPKSAKVIFASKLIEPGAKVKLNFTAPTQPGEYSYVCTFPGHWVRMFGTLVVTADVEEYLAKNPEQAPVITEWKVADLAADLARLDQHRSFAVGKGLFTTLGCFQCHQLGKEGNAFGPPLTGVFAKWKGDRRAVLDQLIEPSKVIEDKFRAWTLEVGDEASVSGLIVAEDNDTVTLQSGPTESLKQKLKKSEVKSRRRSDTSLMPSGLLNTLNKEQILDLLAYVFAEANEQHAAFHH